MKNEQKKYPEKSLLFLIENTLVFSFENIL